MIEQLVKLLSSIEPDAIDNDGVRIAKGLYKIPRNSEDIINQNKLK